MGYASLRINCLQQRHKRENRNKGDFQGIVTVFQIKGPIFIRMVPFLDCIFAKHVATKCRAKFSIFELSQIVCARKFSVDFKITGKKTIEVKY